MMRFENEWILQLLWVIPVMILLYLINMHRKKKAISRWGKIETTAAFMPTYSSSMQSIRFILFVFSYALIILALANPQQGSRMETGKRKGIDIIIAFDISNSMRAEDVSPNRLESTKRDLQRLTNRLAGDRIGIVAFAGTAVRILPITTDYAAANMLISNININMIETQGTAIGTAIESAIEGFSTDDKNRSRVIIVISDGENHEDDAVGAAEEAYKNGILVYTVGIGTPTGSPIPIRRGDFLKDREGNTVITRLNEVMLQKIASAGGGKYFSGMLPMSGLEALYKELDELEKTEIESKVYSDYNSLFQYPLALALLLLVIENIMSNKRIRQPLWLKQKINFEKASIKK